MLCTPLLTSMQQLLATLYSWEEAADELGLAWPGNLSSCHVISFPLLSVPFCSRTDCGLFSGTLLSLLSFRFHRDSCDSCTLTCCCPFQCYSLHAHPCLPACQSLPPPSLSSPPSQFNYVSCCRM